MYVVKVGNETIVSFDKETKEQWEKIKIKNPSFGNFPRWGVNNFNNAICGLNLSFRLPERYVDGRLKWTDVPDGVNPIEHGKYKLESHRLFRQAFPKK